MTTSLHTRWSDTELYLKLIEISNKTMEMKNVPIVRLRQSVGHITEICLNFVMEIQLITSLHLSHACDR